MWVSRLYCLFMRVAYLSRWKRRRRLSECYWLNVTLSVSANLSYVWKHIIFRLFVEILHLRLLSEGHRCNQSGWQMWFLRVFENWRSRAGEFLQSEARGGDRAASDECNLGATTFLMKHRFTYGRKNALKWNECKWKFGSATGPQPRCRQIKMHVYGVRSSRGRAEKSAPSPRFFCPAGYWLESAFFQLPDRSAEMSWTPPPAECN